MSQPPARSAAGEARERLQRATHAAHARLNRHPLLADITRPSYRIADYHRVLLAYHAAYHAIESWIRLCLPALTPSFDYTGRWKLDWLAQDLAHFALPPPGGPGMPPAPPGEASDILGVLYVVEGSTLGGRVISSCLTRNLGLSADAGMRFFSAYEERTEAFWNTLTAYLNRHLDDDRAIAGASRAALATFELVESHLDAQFHRTRS